MHRSEAAPMRGSAVRLLKGNGMSAFVAERPEIDIGNSVVEVDLIAVSIDVSANVLLSLIHL